MMVARALFRIRNSLRSFANTPGTFLALLATIAIGVGSNVIVGGFLSGLAHPRSPVVNSGQVVSIFARTTLSDAGPLSQSEYQAIRSRTAAFSWVDAIRIAPLDVTVNGRSETLTVGAVMPDLAKALNLNVKGGAVLSDHLWTTEFGEEDHGAAQPVRVNRARLSVTGIAPKTLEGLYRDRPIDLWIPFEDDMQEDPDPDRHDLWVLACLRPGISLSDAQRQISSDFDKSRPVEVVPYSGILPGTARGLASIVTLLNFIAVSVFLISCFNVASLLLGRAFERSSETSLRVALGATRRALCGELLSDSVVVAFAGGILGLLLALAAKKVIPSLLFEEDAERLVFVPPAAALITSALVGVGITVLAGMMPMLATVTDRPWTVLQREQGFSSTRVVRLRSALVVLEIALCCALVIFATLLLQGFRDALKTGPGQTLGNPILVTVGRNPLLPFPTDYFKALEQSVRFISHGAPVAWTAQLPGSRPVWQAFRIVPAGLPLHQAVLDTAELTHDNQDQPDLRSTEGRLFEERDLSCRVAVVDEAAANALSGSSTVGEQILDSTGTPVQIIGIAKKVSGDTGSKRPTIYFDPLGPEPHAATKGGHFRAPAGFSPVDIELNVNTVSSSYLQTFGLMLVGGHWFAESEPPLSPCRRVGVINQEAADLYFGGKPLGAGLIDQDGDRTEIIGIVRSQKLGVFQQHAEPTVFLPLWQEYPLRMTAVVRASKLNKQNLALLRRKIEAVPGNDGTLPDIKTLDTQLSRSAFAPLRIATLIALASALAALAVSMIGVFSVQSAVYRERRKVLAIHLAFGAQGWSILAKSLIESGRLVFLGCLAGALASIALQRLLLSGTELIGEPPLRAWLFALLLPCLAVLVSGALAAVRALRLHPMTAMRER